MQHSLQPGAALAELMAEELEGKDPRFCGEIAVAGQPQPPPPPVPEFRPPPPDWELERREELERQAAAERERQEREAAAERERRLAAEIAAADEPQSLPARKRRWRP